MTASRIELPQVPVGCCAPLEGPTLSVEEAEGTSALFRTLGDPTRVRILNLLANSPEPVCVCDINAGFDLSQPTISHHLKKLMSAGLLSREQRGTWAYYSLNQEAMGRLAHALQTKGDGS